MKKLMLATLAIAAFATTSNAQLTSWSNVSMNTRASDQSTMCITVNVPNVLILSPNTGGPISANASFTQVGVGGGFGTTYIGAQQWWVWSNREYFVYYNVPSNFTYSNISNAYDDGDESTTMPISYLQMKLSGNHTNSDASSFGTFTSVTHGTAPVWASANHLEGSSIGNAGGQIINEGKPGLRDFTTEFQLLDPSYNYVGGSYSATFTIWAIQE